MSSFQTNIDRSNSNSTFVVSQQNGNLYVWFGETPFKFDQTTAFHLMTILYQYLSEIDDTESSKTRFNSREI